MQSLHKVTFTLVMCALAIGRAEAQSTCPKDEPWACYGSIEMAFAADDESSVARISRFANGEILGEISGSKSGQQKLLVLRPFIRLYYGVPDKEIKEGFPFIFFDYAFAVPAMALKAAFPLGSASVVATGNSMPVHFDGMEGKLSVERQSATRIKYRLELHDQKGMVMTGYWDTAVLKPLADEYKLSDWKSCGLKNYATVGAGRRSDEVCPMGKHSDNK